MILKRLIVEFTWVTVTHQCCLFGFNFLFDTSFGGQFLTDANINGVKSSSVTWNFQKYLIDEEGKLVDVISPRTQPDDPKIVDWIKS